jgi:hypothetical protein
MDECPGDDPWKSLYNKSRAMEHELWEKCRNDPDPTRDWAEAKHSGLYAMAISGGMRSFIPSFHAFKTNVVDSSGGDNVHLYFHVWGDEGYHKDSVWARESRNLAQSLPNTKAFVEEAFEEHIELLDKQQPHARSESSHSWIGDIEEQLVAEKKRIEERPFMFGAFYSQWRKVYLVHELIRNSGIEYALIVRCRPDINILEPLDLRTFQADMQSRESAKRTKGHFIALPERSMQAVVDHVAIGTPEVMYLYAKEPFPYTITNCELYVWRNLEMRCFGRSDSVINEEFSDPASAMDATLKGMLNGSRNNWVVNPKSVRGLSKYSPILLNDNTFYAIGMESCTRNRGIQSKCIPIYRTRFTYVFRAQISAWLSEGALCMRDTLEGYITGPFLLRARIASALLPEVEFKYNNGPCVHVPSLMPAWNAAQAWLKSIDFVSRSELLTI